MLKRGGVKFAHRTQAKQIPVLKFPRSPLRSSFIVEANIFSNRNSVQCVCNGFLTMHNWTVVKTILLYGVTSYIPAPTCYAGYDSVW